ncbi:hypothetical protein SNE40_023312 [Patella caerulea]|uniref:NADP-dependent oxidoreductase domain-containing protein n=1 Tax=Patella caerulea TaxID=87958 RepID=A0AAN8G2P0_PATCE
MAVTIATSLSSTVKLNDGVDMPLFGLGTFRCESGANKEAENAVVSAIQLGYRYIDTAVLYGNEEDVGRGIKRSGVKREDIFVTTKVWDDCHGYDECKKSFQASFKRLDCGYVDQLLIHSPNGGRNVEMYKAMLEFKQQGLVRSVGVSNFGIHHIQGLLDAGMPTPSVNQIEFHPWMKRPKLVDFCREKNIVVVGYCPIVRQQKFDDPDVVRLSKMLNKSPGQILIRYSVQMGIITIPKSGNPKRIKENAEVFDWEIPQEGMDSLNSKEESGITWDPCSSSNPWLG